MRRSISTAKKYKIPTRELLKTSAFQDLQDGVTAVAKLALEGLIDGQADTFRRAMETKRTHVDQRVRRLNERAYALVENEVRPPRSPRGDSSAIDC